MIHITNIRNVKSGTYDEIWAIVRVLKGQSKILKQVPELSPSRELFIKYRQLAKEGKWSKETFESFYVPIFIKEMKESQIAKDRLNYLYKQDKLGKNLCLVCFCVNEELCHRSIIAGFLQAVGCNVMTDTMNDYTKYYEMYQLIS